VAKSKIPDELVCPKCTKGKATKSRPRCAMCAYEGNKFGCDCGGSYTVKCETCNGKGVISPWVYDCYRCGRTSYSDSRCSPPDGWKEVRCETGEDWHKNKQTFWYKVCGKCDWRPRARPKRKTLKGES